jgi:hypothetical protein
LGIAKDIAASATLRQNVPTTCTNNRQGLLALSQRTAIWVMRIGCGS